MKQRTNVVYVLSGRAFTYAQLQRQIIAASGGYMVGLALIWESWLLWRIVEAIENVAASQQNG